MGFRRIIFIDYGNPLTRETEAHIFGSMKTWAQRITELEAAGWSLTALGAHIGLSPQSLSDIKQGRSKEPRGMAAVRLHGMEGLTPEQARSEKIAA